MVVSIESESYELNDVDFDKVAEKIFNEMPYTEETK
jgi:hypothetical protein